MPGKGKGMQELAQEETPSAHKYEEGCEEVCEAPQERQQHGEGDQHQAESNFAPAGNALKKVHMLGAASSTLALSRALHRVIPRFRYRFDCSVRTSGASG